MGRCTFLLGYLKKKVAEGVEMAGRQAVGGEMGKTGEI